MYDIWFGLDTITGAALILVWTLVAWRPGRVTLTLAAVPTLVKAALIVMFLSYGWAVGQNSLLFAFPLVMAPALATYAGRDTARLTVAGAVLAFCAGFVRQPAGGLGDDVLLYGGLFLLAALGVDRVRKRVLLPVLAVLVVGGMVWAGTSSRLPAGYGMAGHEHHGRPVTELTGPVLEVPEVRFTLTARTTGDRFTFNGSTPGPVLRVRQHQLVEVTLINQDVAAGVTLHWHGVDVPNAEDGVPGLTQDAVPPGGRFVYRFRPPDAGSYWYHSHQAGSEQVRGGLFGAFIVDPPAGPDPSVTDLPVALHTFKGQIQTMNGVDKLDRRTVAAGRAVRLRLINTDSLTRKFTITGTPYVVSAIDGTDLTEPPPVTGEVLELGAGARYDATFTMPAHPVRLATTGHRDAGLLLTPDGSGDLAAGGYGPVLDPTRYGRPSGTPAGTPDQRVTWVIDNHFGFYDGTFRMVFTVNGHLFPDVPPIVVDEGDLVRVRFVNRSFLDHPMHLHGHHALVLSRDGRAVTGSPLWLDTVLVHPGETYEIQFRADNPGLWMDHCHNLEHAAAGMMMHVAYRGWTTPFVAGSGTANEPE